MVFVRRNVWLAVFAALTVALILAGCSDDDGPATPQEGKGTITIDQAPDVLTGAGWTMTGPQNKTGSGDTTLTAMPVGTYTLTWNAVSGYSTPSEDTKPLTASGTTKFSGVYMPAGFVLIPAGTFIMGSPTDEPERDGGETQHTVTLTRSLYMWATEVTNVQCAELAQWAYDHGYCTATSDGLSDALDGSTQLLLGFDEETSEISFSGGTFTVDAGKEEHPVKWVSWYGAVAYCDWLSLRDGLPRAYDHSTWQCNGGDPYNAQGYRLPTEAEWEYACRAGTETPFNTGECLDAGTEANYNGNYPYPGCPAGPDVGATVPVGSYSANPWGLYDMHGNAWEWCNDWYGDYSGDETDPEGPAAGSDRVRRGGSFVYSASICRSAFRYYSFPYYGYGSTGFRPVRSAD